MNLATTRRANSADAEGTHRLRVERLGGVGNPPSRTKLGQRFRLERREDKDDDIELMWG
jgi:hypothetical protein